MVPYMSTDTSKIAGIFQQQNSDLLSTLNSMKWEKTEQSNAIFTIPQFAGNVDARTFEKEIVDIIRGAIRTGKAISDEDVDSYDAHLEEIEEVYKQKDSSVYIEFLERIKLITFALTSYAQRCQKPEETTPQKFSGLGILPTKRIKFRLTQEDQNRTKPKPISAAEAHALMSPHTPSNITSFFKTNAQSTMIGLSWDATEAAAKTSPEVSSALTKEKTQIGRLKKRVNTGPRLENTEYKDIEFEFNSIAFSYANHPDALQEFKQRQHAIMPALRYLFESHNEKEYAPFKALRDINADASNPTQHPENGTPLGKAQKTNMYLASLLGELGASKPKPPPKKGKVTRLKLPKNDEPG